MGQFSGVFGHVFAWKSTWKYLPTKALVVFVCVEGVPTVRNPGNPQGRLMLGNLKG